jgi:hypothetical protein
MVGVLVKYCGHDGWFVADVYEVAGAVVVRAGDKVSPFNLMRGVDPAFKKDARYHLRDFPTAGFWRPDLGTFVVPADQLEKL